MSADNGIYILETLDGYRVEHLQAVENYMWDESIGGTTDDPDVHIKNAREMWKHAKYFDVEHETEALAYAAMQAKEYPILEYCISVIKIPRYFDEQVPKKLAFLDDFYQRATVHNKLNFLAQKVDALARENVELSNRLNHMENVLSLRQLGRHIRLKI